MGRQVKWESFKPEFHLQEGEKVVRELRGANLGINPHLFIILTVLTFGIFLFFWQYFRYPRSAKIIILTNTRILQWETTIGSNPKILRQEFYQISKISYYQHELVQSTPPCFGLCACLTNSKPWTTFRVFFSKYPSEMPPSYNQSPGIKPAFSTTLRVAQEVASAVKNGMAQNYIGMAIDIIKGMVKIAQHFLDLVTRPEIILGGHYVEIDTNDEGSAQEIQKFISEMLELYPRRNMLTKNKHEGAVVFGDDLDRPLWVNKEDPVFLNPTYLQLAPGEVILEAIAEPPVVTLKDWLLAVVTFSIYYFVVIRDLKNYKGSLIVTDRRLISIFVHNLHGLKPETKYIQLSNSWFFHRFGDAVVRIAKPDNCIFKLFKSPEYIFMMEVGPGTIQLVPNHKNGKEKIFNFFSHFFGYNHDQFVSAASVPQKSGKFREGFLLPGEEVLAQTGKKTPKNCAFKVARICCCGIAPPDVKQYLVVSTHRLGVTLDASNWWEPEIVTYDYFTSLANLSGLQLHELDFALPCACITCKRVQYATISIALGRDEYWSLPIVLPITPMSEKSVQEFAGVISTAQHNFENMEKGVVYSPQHGRVYPNNHNNNANNDVVHLTSSSSSSKTPSTNRMSDGSVRVSEAEQV